ncbi:MAG: hypothetical protein B7Z55_05370 [Planctomycetales bacterium 12-60-4]|nr:MAG: hypothetical protein B7Z55_05370 [Planctomycetales bacterium 12-60-4]
MGYAQRSDDAKPRLPRAELEQDVVSRLASMEDIVVSEVQLDEQQARVTIRGVQDRPGIAAEVFAAVAEGGVMVDMIVQNVGHDQRTDLSFTVPRVDLERCLLLVRELIEQWPGAELSYDADMALLTVMGIGLRTHTGVGDRMFRALSDAGVNVQLVNTSEIRFGVVVARANAGKAHTALLQAFGLTNGN